MEDDSSDDDEDEDGDLNPRDGTLQVNDPNPKPLRELQARKGPLGRPLPPTPDDGGGGGQDGDTMRRAGQMNRLDSQHGMRVMPDLLPTSSGPNTPLSRMSAQEEYVLSFTIRVINAFHSR